MFWPRQLSQSKGSTINFVHMALLQLHNSNLCTAKLVSHINGESRWVRWETKDQTERHCSLSNTATLKTKLVYLPYCESDSLRPHWGLHPETHPSLDSTSNVILERSRLELSAAAARSCQVAGDKEKWLQTHFIMTNVQDQIYKKWQ